MEKVTPEQRLSDMLEKGKITRLEYQQLLDAIQKSELEDKPPSQQSHKSMFAGIPWQIWVVTTLLVWGGLGELSMISRNPVIIFVLLARCLIVFGLLKRIKWIYCFFIFACLANIIYFWQAAIPIALINLPLIGLVVWKHRFYFPKREEIT